MAELASLLIGKTLLVMGDSVMEQFYNVLQCWMRKEEILAPHSAQFEAFIQVGIPRGEGGHTGRWRREGADGATRSRV
jgi:hypothetical protein